ncbi:MAG: MerR family transcriptional regulator [Saprospiraceae bacterium]
MNLFSISDLQQFSGVKAHTIRIWEQRYKALKPERSDGNTRYYDGSQLQRLLNIVSLKSEKHKISALCTMSDEKLNNLVITEFLEVAESDQLADKIIDQCIVAAINFNEDKFNHFLTKAFKKYGIKDAYEQIIYPMLIRIGLMWSGNRLPVAQEHFISQLIQQKLFSEIEKLPIPVNEKPTWMLFLLEEELHEIGLVFSNYLLKRAGHKVIYLGSNLPFSTLEYAVNKVNPTNLLFFMVRKNDHENDLESIDKMRKTFTAQKIYVATDPNRLPTLKNTKNFIQLHTIEDLLRQTIQIV